MIDPDVALIVCRFLFDAAAIFLWGTSFFLGVVIPAHLAQEIDNRLQTHQRIALMVVIAMTVVLLPLRAATIGDGWNDAVDPTTLEAVLFETNVGQAWMAQAVAAALLCGTALISISRRQIAMAIAAALLLATLAMTGHAAMNSGWSGMLHRCNDIAHLLSAGAWLGALVPVLTILPMLANADLGIAAQQALTRFSLIGHFAVAITIGTGLANTYLVVGGPPLDRSIPYQALLTLKIMLVGAMIVLALINRYVFVPRLSSERPRALSALVRGTIAEIIVGIAVIVLVAWFGTLDPQ